ncbi:hypothetical protein BH11MYX1_BH11MYX1_56920 [soil metagenome]
MQRPARLPVLIALAIPAFARGDGATDAKAMFDRGRELVKAGNSNEACPLFEQSLKLAPALGTKLNLAICWAATGKLATAQRLFEELVAETTGANQAQRLALAREGLEGLAGRVPHVKIDRSALAAGTVVALDGHRVDGEQPIVVDPGRHTITAPHARDVEVEAVEGKVVEVHLDPITLTARPRQVWIVGGAAAGALVVTALAGLAVLGERSSAAHHCGATIDGLTCDQGGLELLDRAHTMQHVSTGFFVAGAALGAMTAILELKWRRSNEMPVPTTWSAPHALGVAFEGAW